MNKVNENYNKKEKEKEKEIEEIQKNNKEIIYNSQKSFKSQICGIFSFFNRCSKCFKSGRRILCSYCLFYLYLYLFLCTIPIYFIFYFDSKFTLNIILEMYSHFIRFPKIGFIFSQSRVFGNVDKLLPILSILLLLLSVFLFIFEKIKKKIENERNNNNVLKLQSSSSSSLSSSSLSSSSRSFSRYIINMKKIIRIISSLQTIIFLSIKSTILSAFLCGILKYIFRRSRPICTSLTNQWKWCGPLHSILPQFSLCTSFSSSSSSSSSIFTMVLSTFQLFSSFQFSQLENTMNLIFHEMISFFGRSIGGIGIGIGGGRGGQNNHHDHHDCEFSFPSGHTSSSCAFFLILCYQIQYLLRNYEKNEKEENEEEVIVVVEEKKKEEEEMKKKNKISSHSIYYSSFSSYSSYSSYSSSHMRIGDIINFMKYFLREIFIPFVCLLLIFISSLSKVLSTQHWASDVYFGLLIGKMVSTIVFKIYHKRDNPIVNLIAKPNQTKSNQIKPIQSNPVQSSPIQSNPMIILNNNNFNNTK